ncbi:hypothetical protein D6861_009225 [Macrococcoides caseolyticum]|nr:hypothetical protein [Macrococcus caseolyticus]RKO16371.1 hypothetical protein D6861_03105 [Macrococcus caseolyticus]
MKLDDFFFRIIAIILSMAFFGLYLFAMGNIYNLNPWNFPYNIITGYFILSLICYPFIALNASEFALEVKLVRSLVQVVAFVISPILFIILLIKKGKLKK